jgi:enoyl-CoA hydratase/carnithine racemase
VMGGGIGLMSGASHRVVSERSKLAFPEITVGLFPDVGGSWLLPRVPGKGGLFLALTGAPLNAGDAIYAGLADIHIVEAQREAVFNALADVHWSEDAKRNHDQLSALLQQHASDAATGPLLRNAATVDALCGGDDVDSIVAAIAALHTEDPWLTNAQATLAAGAPGSARLAFELQRRTAGATLAEVYRLEYIAALHAAAHGDFAEGIRALLIDKDRTPHWQPSTLADATAAWADTFFVSPWSDAAHPLADLGATVPERSRA